MKKRLLWLKLRSPVNIVNLNSEQKCLGVQLAHTVRFFVTAGETQEILREFNLIYQNPDPANSYQSYQIPVPICTPHSCHCQIPTQILSLPTHVIVRIPPQSFPSPLMSLSESHQGRLGDHSGYLNVAYMTIYPTILCTAFLCPLKCGFFQFYVFRYFFSENIAVIGCLLLLTVANYLFRSVMFQRLCSAESVVP